ncbi:MAG: hypothetical protein HC888_00680 [Candidatus Competibacteraceae bacterium]|nr:hypothetical protein [Candidatus Competibacteraceae bacterium]
MNIVNFSSPHAFTFTDGTVLEAVPKELSMEMMLEPVEVETPHPILAGVTDIKLCFNMTDPVQRRLERLETDPSVDIVIVPFPVMEAIKKAGLDLKKPRVCRVADRVQKTIYKDRFCI